MSSVAAQLPLLGALATGFAGVGALRLGWRRHRSPRGRLVPAGWLLLGVSLWLWWLARGAEFGTAMGLAWLAVAAWLLIGAGAEVRAPAASREASSGSGTSSGHKWLTFAAAGPLAGIASCQLTVLLVLKAPLSDIAAMATAALLYPILWGLASYWTCYRVTPGRHALLYLVLAAASAALLY